MFTPQSPNFPIALNETKSEDRQRAWCRVFFDTKACQLTQNNGNVTGVIAQKADSSYIRLNAESGVILAAGDYSKNEVI